MIRQEITIHANATGGEIRLRNFPEQPVTEEEMQQAELIQEVVRELQKRAFCQPPVKRAVFLERRAG